MKKFVRSYLIKDYIEKCLEAFGITTQIKERAIDSDGEAYYECKFVDGNQELQAFNSLGVFDICLEDKEGLDKLHVKIINKELGENIYYSRKKDELGLMEWASLFYKEQGNSLKYQIETCEKSIMRRYRLYCLSIEQSLIGTATITFLLHGYPITISIGIGDERLSLEDYVEILKEKLVLTCSASTITENDKKWIDVILTDPRVLEYLQKIVLSAPKTEEEVVNYISNQRKEKLAQAAERRTHAIAKADDNYNDDLAKIEQESHKALEQLIELMSEPQPQQVKNNNVPHHNQMHLERVI